MPGTSWTTCRSPTRRAGASPGSGAIDWPASLAVLRAAGYDGPIGLEYFPTIESAESLQVIRSAAAAA